jgi:hypothetical protein
MKKLFVILLSALMLMCTASFIACSNDEENENDETPSNEITGDELYEILTKVSYATSLTISYDENSLRVDGANQILQFTNGDASQYIYQKNEKYYRIENNEPVEISLEEYIDATKSFTDECKYNDAINTLVQIYTNADFSSLSKASSFTFDVNDGEATLSYDKKTDTLTIKIVYSNNMDENVCVPVEKTIKISKINTTVITLPIN